MHLSDKPIPVEERLIVALDVDTMDEALALVGALGESVRFYKLGLQLLMGGRYFDLADELARRGKKVFMDVKFFDVPETVGAAMRQVAAHGAEFVTVHGNDAMLEAAVREKSGTKVLAVTALTSLDRSDLDALGFAVAVRDLVLSRARRALDLGCDGVISSGLEAADLREVYGGKFLIVSPGIRPVDNKDDHKRTVDVEQAFRNGADYIVVGRPIREPKGGVDPTTAAHDVQRRIAAVFDA